MSVCVVSTGRVLCGCCVSSACAVDLCCSCRPRCVVYVPFVLLLLDAQCCLSSRCVGVVCLVQRRAPGEGAGGGLTRGGGVAGSR